MLQHEILKASIEKVTLKAETSCEFCEHHKLFPTAKHSGQFASTTVLTSNCNTGDRPDKSQGRKSSCVITTTILSQEQLENGSFPVSNRINRYERSLACLCVQKTMTTMLERLWSFIVSCTNASWKMHLVIHLITNYKINISSCYSRKRHKEKGI